MNDQIAFPSSPQPNVILITFDALAAQNMSLYGYDRRITPHLDAFARKSYVFKNAFANCNSTLPSLRSILTGKYPLPPPGRHDLFMFDQKERRENLGGVLRKNGYHIAAVLGTSLGYPILSRLKFIQTDETDFLYGRRAVAARWMASSLSFFKAHFPFWKEYSAAIFSRTFLFGWSREAVKQRIPANSADRTFTKAAELLQTLPSPFFLWIHIYPPHDPYLPSPKFKYHLLSERILDTFDTQKPYLNRRYPETMQPIINQLKSRYDELVWSTDDSFGVFLESITRKNLLDHSILLLTSDHGEMFEKGYQGHDGTFLSRPLIHIPLILHMPKQEKGKRITENVEQVDMAPTLLDLLGMEIPPWMEGESLRRAMEGASLQGKPKYSVSLDLIQQNRGPQTGSIAVTYEDYKFVFSHGDRNKELYHLSRDPGEQTNLASFKKSEVKFFEQLVTKRMFRTPGSGWRQAEH